MYKISGTLFNNSCDISVRVKVVHWLADICQLEKHPNFKTFLRKCNIFFRQIEYIKFSKQAWCSPPGPVFSVWNKQIKLAHSMNHESAEASFEFSAFLTTPNTNAGLYLNRIWGSLDFTYKTQISEWQLMNHKCPKFSWVFIIII